MRIFTVGIVVLMLAGCYSGTAVSSNVRQGPAKTETVWYVPWGLGKGGPVGEECTNGLASVNNKFTIIDYVVRGISLGIAARSTVTYSCVEGGAVPATQHQR